MLREYIRKLLEVYELSDEDKFKQSLVARKNKAVQRVFGLQNKEDIEAERTYLQQYQKKLRSNMAGLAMISSFEEGDISVCHSPFYFGYAAGEGTKKVESPGQDRYPFTNWLRKYGRNNKDMISCIAFNKPIGSFPDGGSAWTTLTNYQAFEGMGFYMKGYPVYVSKHDVMSQTLGALPKGLVDHQKQSGIAKRPGVAKPGSREEANEISGVDWEWAGEALLDNWKPIGIYINVESEGVDLEYYNIADFIYDAEQTNLPIYLFTFDQALGKFTDMKSLRDKLESIGSPWFK